MILALLLLLAKTTTKAPDAEPAAAPAQPAAIVQPATTSDQGKAQSMFAPEPLVAAPSAVLDAGRPNVQQPPAVPEPPPAPPPADTPKPAPTTQGSGTPFIVSA